VGRRPTPQTFDHVLDKIRRESKNTHELGARFEGVMADFFRTDRHYRNRFVKVHRWRSWPGNDGQADTGVDLVAEEADGTRCAIQCKCYDEKSNLDMKKVSNFVATAKAYGLDNLILVYTGEYIGRNAMNLLRKSKCHIMTPAHLRAGSVDWADFPRLVQKKPKKLRQYQQDALDDVVRGFSNHKRGKLIMACGTGKTLVALRAAEKLVGRGGAVMYLVPSISLILQSMREWSDNAGIKHRYLAVCSDSSAGGEEGSITELECPASTSPGDLRRIGSIRDSGAMTVVFSTYHSVRVAAKALDGKFDLVLCDEAHRTTGAENDTHYTFVHSDDSVLAKRRLYMTATPKIYGEAAKGAARGRLAKKRGKKEADLEDTALYSMDDEKTYGPEFHRLGFVDAVHKHHALADFRVIIPMVSPKYVDEAFQQAVAKDGAMPLNEKTLLAAVWHGLQYPDGADEPKRLLQKVIAFTNRIDRSKMFAGIEPNVKGVDISFASLVGEISALKKEFEHGVAVRHIDGKNNALQRREEMRWLGESGAEPNTCRILSNARCLSEGVDVPALDGVVFLNPRESIVDIVQSVGRVMRKAEGKDTGYVVLPVAIPAGIDTNKALSSHPAYRTVWQVLNALRSHDESLAREINSLTLDRDTPGDSDGGVTHRISVSILGAKEDGAKYRVALLDKIKSTLVRKVGDIDYYSMYGRKIGKAAETVELRIRGMLEASAARRADLDGFHADLRLTINESVTRDEAIRVIAQHVVLSRVFDELFSGEFTSYNPISRVLSDMAAGFGLDEELEELEGFYVSVRDEVRAIETPVARQNFIKTIYENFFKSTTKKDTEKHGVVFTPVPVVDFVIRSVQGVLQGRFGMGFGDTRVKVLEPFAGTGTFITRLLGSGLLGGNMYQKYRNDLMANEMILLAYYISTVNIETTYSSLNRGRYVPFENMSYTDTLRQDPRYHRGGRHAQEQATLGGRFKEANRRVRRQKSTHVNVIMGNPPYSAGQRNYNDENPNVEYPGIDRRIAETYLRGARVHAKNALYDSYVRSLRWASDRIGASGVVAFVTNGSFMRSEAAAGIRASLAEEFDEVWCLDLRGNQRTQGETSRKEGGKIFGSGSRAPVAVVVLVKAPTGPDPKRPATIRYRDIGDYLTREEKLEAVEKFGSIKGVPGWETIEPDRHNDWLGQRDDRFEDYAPMGAGKTKAGRANAVFRTYAPGVKSNRDSWVYNSSHSVLAKNMQLCIDHCNQQNLDNIIIDPTKAKWSVELKDRLKKTKPTFSIHNIRKSLYRPFFYQFLYFDKIYNNSIHHMPEFFPSDKSENLVICVPYKFTGDFSTFITAHTPDLEIVHHGQCFPFYTYTGSVKKDNISDNILNEYRLYYDTKEITKKDIFYYVYGFLHHPTYKIKFANNLSKDLPNIPMASNFTKFKNIGEKLAKLHLNFELCKRFKLGKPLEKFDKPHKLSFGRKGMRADKTKLRINGVLVFENIPQPKYRVNGRTPLEWIVDRYNRTVDKDSGIVNDPLEGMGEDDIIAVIERAVYVGVESDRLIAELPDEFEPKDWKPKKTGLEAHMALDTRKDG